jgi:hypothetical protein
MRGFRSSRATACASARLQSGPMAGPEPAAEPAPEPKRVFLSYAWEDDDYRLWVKRLAHACARTA